MKINWFSNAPWASTGYGNQTKLFVPRIAKLGHEMTITAFYGLQGGIVGSPYDGIKVYPNGRHPYGQDVIGAHAIDAKADVIISLFDIWAMQPENIPSSIKWFPWFPIDSEPMPPQVLQQAMKAEKSITMSKFGKSIAEQMGLDAYYVPHGVDTKLFRNVDQTQAREYLSFPKDKFIVGTVAANKGLPPRKSWYELIMAFAALKQQHKDVMFYIHTDDGARGGETVDIAKFCQVLGLKVGYIQQYNAEPYNDVDVLIVDQYINLLGAPDDYMVAVYNALDVMMLVSRGEGFGIPIVEAQACGCPVIVGDWTAMGELCFSGWKVHKDEAIPEWQTYQDAWMYQPKIEAIVDRLLQAYEMKGNQDYRQRAREGALYYDVDKVTEKYWKPVLADIEQRLNKTVKIEKVQL